jgi:hypothetical protein
MEEENSSYFIQAYTGHTATYSNNALNEVYEDRLISFTLWPARSPDLNLCDIYLWGNLKSKLYSNNPHHTLDELRHKHLGNIYIY